MDNCLQWSLFIVYTYILVLYRIFTGDTGNTLTWCVIRPFRESAGDWTLGFHQEPSIEFWVNEVVCIYQLKTNKNQFYVGISSTNLLSKYTDIRIVASFENIVWLPLVLPRPKRSNKYQWVYLVDPGNLIAVDKRTIAVVVSIFFH